MLTNNFTDEQIKIFRSKFSGRENAYGLDTSNGPIAVREPLTDKIVVDHLSGEKRIGVYPITDDNSVKWLVIDVDEVDECKKPNTRKAKENAIKIYVRLIENNLFPYLEISKSKGFHLWLFFDESIPAKIVRRVLKKILKDLGLEYEVFPKQDQLTSNNGLGNFIYLPLNGELAKIGKTLFVDSNFQLYPDQWEHLSKIHLTKKENILYLAEQLEAIPQKSIETEDNTKQSSVENFDIPSYLNYYHIPFTTKKEGSRTLYRLERCPFDTEHTIPDKKWQPAIIQGKDGKITYYCFHAHCANKRWADIRQIISGNDSLVQFIKGYIPHNPDLKQTERQELTYSNLHLPSSLEISKLEISVKWLVQNLIPEESITLLHSIGGVGKTYLMYKIGKCVADGIPFFGLKVKSMNVYYIDYENPLPEIVDRMKKIGGSENLKIWHLGHDPMPVRIDAPEWEIYKTFPPGLFIIDSLRSSHLLEENSSKDASFVMARHKELRSIGSTIFLIHHESKAGGYRGSTAWFDLADHILKFSRVKKIGSDEDVDDDDFTLPIRLGLGGKSRFSSAMDLSPMYFRFEDHQLCSAEDPDNEMLNKMAQLLGNGKPPNQTEFQKLVRDNLGIGRKSFLKLLKEGDNKNLWYSKRSSEGNKFEYFRTL